MTGGALLVGAARLSLEPPLGLPLVGFVRQTHDATGYGRWGLETSAIAVEQDGLRIVLCGVDIVGIGEPEISVLLDRVAEATGADPAGILVNWNHTHLSVIGGAWGGGCAGPPEPERDARIRRFADVVQDKVVAVCSLACERLEPTRPVWGVGDAELAVNRRERMADGTTILGYLPTASEYRHGGYEAGYGYKSVGLPSLFDPDVERILVATGVRLAERLFPDAEPWDEAAGWLAGG